MNSDTPSEEAPRNDQEGVLHNEIPGFIVTWLNGEGEREEGPLSLLWQLIESYKVDIFEVSLKKITEDFLEFIHRAEDLKVELASPFVVMAARLLFYKSRALLPDPGFDESENEDRLPPELVQQLLEYRKFQLAAEKMREMEEVSFGVMSRSSGYRVAPEAHEEEWLDLEIVDLVHAYSRVMRRLEEMKPEERHYEIDAEEYSVEEKMQYIRVLLEQAASFTFEDLFENLEAMLRVEVVVTFLAILELVKLREILVRQNLIFGEIRIFPRSVVLT